MLHNEIIYSLKQSINLEEAIKNSYTNFHAVGVDYLCLFRNDRFTVKVYRFNKDYRPNEEGWAVNPHNHAYEFRTYVLNGTVKNLLFYEDERYKVWKKFEYSSPLNGGNGFKYTKDIGLNQYSDHKFYQG